MKPETEKKIKNAVTCLLFSDDGYIFEKFVLMTRFEEKELETALAEIEPKSTEIIIRVNPNHTKNLSIKSIIAILKHEYNHILLGHIWARLPDAIKDNIAADLEINQKPVLEIPDELKKMSLTPNQLGLPEGKSREWYYQQLSSPKSTSIKSRVRDNKKGGANKSGKDNGNNKNGDNKNSGGIPSPNIDSHDSWDKSETQAAQAVYEKIVREIVEEMKKRGNCPGDYIEKIEAGWKKEVSLERILKRIITKAYKGSYGRKQTYLRSNRRNPVLPGTKSHYGPLIVLALDTSGSMSTKELQEILSVYRWMAKKFNVELIQCDAAVHEITKNLKKTVIEIKGRGGTDFKPVFEYITKKYKDKIDLLIYGTDLEGDFPEKTPPYKVVWLTTLKNKRAPFGEIVQLKGMSPK